MERYWASLDEKYDPFNPLFNCCLSVITKLKVICTDQELTDLWCSPKCPICGRVWYKNVRRDGIANDEGIYNTKELRHFNSKEEIPEGWKFACEEDGDYSV
jgi:hypothetical protein